MDKCLLAIKKKKTVKGSFTA